MVEISSNWERVALGGLLHDIGKFFNKSNIYKKKGITGAHPFLSKWFLEFLEENEVLKADYMLNEIVQKHHESKKITNEKMKLSSIENITVKKMANIIAKADNFSSMERELVVATRPFQEVPLDSIFSRIEIGKGNSEISQYLLKEFSGENIFPKIHKRNVQDDINLLIENFLSEVKQIKTKEFKTLYLALTELIKKYIWAIPSDTQKSICDLSLYDHLKTTSAIATASYNFHSENDLNLEKTSLSKINLGKTEPQFLLIAGDVSGIQNYLYSLVSSENIAKRLRARSFFIRLIIDMVTIKIIGKLNLTMNNIIISNGGKFYILAQNTQETIFNLEKIKEEINRTLYFQYEAEIFLNLQWIGTSGEDLGLKFSEKYDEINDLLDIGKKFKFANEILNTPIIEKRGYTFETSANICPICNKYLKKIEEKNCKKCTLDKIWGGELPKNKMLVFYGKEIKSETSLDIFGLSAELMKNDKNIENHPLLIMDFSEETNFLDYPRVKAFYGGYVPVKNNEVLTFEEIAAQSKSKNLGVLKGDIDDLGIIFSLGLKTEEIDEEDNTIYRDVTSISRIATLSRMLDSFFSYWLPKKLEEERETIGDHYVVYAGGDDFMIVGAWDNMVDVSKLIRDEFEKFTGFNPSFTISMGLSVTKDKDPIYMSSKWATGLEELVKTSGKNGLGIFDRYIPWSDYNRVFGFGDFLIELREKHSISQSFLYRLLNYTGMAEKYNETKDGRYLSYISKFEYDMGRNIIPKLPENATGKKIIEELTKYFGHEGFVDARNRKFLNTYMRVALNYAVRKNREVGDV